MAPLHYAAKFDPFLSLGLRPTPSTLAQSKERKASNLAIWQPCCLSRLSAASDCSFVLPRDGEVHDEEVGDVVQLLAPHHGHADDDVAGDAAGEDQSVEDAENDLQVYPRSFF